MWTIFRMQIVATAIGSLIVPANLVMAQQVPGAIIYTVIIPAGEFGSTAFTGVVVSGLAAIKKFCSGLDEAYRIDCLAERFGVLSKSIPKNSDYGEVQAVLRSTSARLAKLARNNRNRSLPRGKVTSPGTSETTTRPLTPV